MRQLCVCVVSVGTVRVCVVIESVGVRAMGECGGNVCVCVWCGE